jgi:PAS domain S-box-containing protein
MTDIKPAGLTDKLALAVERMAYHVMITDINGVILYVNPAFERTTGYSRDDVIGQTPKILKSGEQSQEYYQSLWRTILSGQEFSSVVKNRKKTGEMYYAQQLVSPIKDETGVVTHFVSTWQDITQRMRWEDKLRESNEELVARERELEKANEAIKFLYKDLETKNADLHRLDQLKSDFVSIVSHELRTPLAISIEGINLILDGIVGDLTDKQKYLLTTSHDNLIRLNTIINDLLDVQKIEAGKVVLKQGLVDFKVLILKIVDDYQKVVKKRKQILNVKLPPQEMFLYVDGDKIIQVMTNLLNNAHKFTPEGGSIEVEIIEQDEDFLCRVKDNGIGLSEDNLAKLFQKFQQFARADGAAGLKGTGLGLAISKSLIELHGGKIWAESKLNKGTTFNFTLSKYDFLRKKFDRQIDKVISEANLKKENVAFIVLRLVNADMLKEKYGSEILIKIMNAVFASFGNILTRLEDFSMLYNIHTVYFVLPKTDKEGAKAVIGKLKEAINNCPLDIQDKNELEFKFGFAICPQEVGNRETLIDKASHRQ